MLPIVLGYGYGLMGQMYQEVQVSLTWRHVNPAGVHSYLIAGLNVYVELNAGDPCRPCLGYRKSICSIASGSRRD